MHRFIVDRNKNYTTVSNVALQDRGLSWKAKGLLVYLLSLPESWEPNLADLETRSKDGRDGTGAGLSELIKSGYVSRRRVVTELGRFIGYDYTVSETPKTDFPETAKPYTDFPKTENPLLLSTHEEVSTKKVSTEITHKPTKHKHGEYQHVLLTTSELDKLKTDFPLDWQDRITRLDEYIEMKGAKYKNHNLTIRSWAKRDREKQSAPTTGPSYQDVVNFRDPAFADRRPKRVV